MARFLTTEDIDLKPDAYVPLDLIYQEPKFQSNIIHGLATRGPKMKNTKSAIASLLLNRFLGNLVHTCIALVVGFCGAHQIC